MVYLHFQANNTNTVKKKELKQEQIQKEMCQCRKTNLFLLHFTLILGLVSISISKHPTSVKARHLVKVIVLNFKRVKVCEWQESERERGRRA